MPDHANARSILTPTHKSCRRCGEIKTHGEFHKMRDGRGGLGIWCKACQKDYHREWRAKPENRLRERAKYRRHDLKRDFGITVEQYDTMFAAQGGVCAICFNPCKSGRRLAVDHDHDTGAIRGLLCSSCNHGIGFLGDDPERLRSAIRYLEERREGVIFPHHGRTADPAHV